MRALVALVFLLVGRTAAADAPTAYQCNPGSPKVGVGCTCPAGFATGRDEENIAVCKLARKPTEASVIKRECARVDAAVVRVSGATLSADELKKFKPVVGKAAIARCENGPWRKEVRACFGKAGTEEAAHECLELLPPVQRGGLEVDAARAHPIAVTVGKDRLELKGTLVFAQATSELSSVSTPLIDAIAKTLKTTPTMRVEVRGFIDTGEDADLGLRLAERRAQALRRALIAAGVPAARVLSKGFGDKLPVASNSTAWGRSKNRRIELALLPADPKAAPDRDQDGIPDATDRCPDQAENLNDFEDTDGCPDKKTTITSTSIQILDVISFKTVSTVIDPAGRALLDSVASILKRELAMRIRLVGHTDDVEPDPVKLGAARARAVREYLIKAGVDGGQVEVFTHGESRPRAANADEASRAQNRRVEFEVL